MFTREPKDSDCGRPFPSGHNNSHSGLDGLHVLRLRPPTSSKFVHFSQPKWTRPPLGDYVEGFFIDWDYVFSIQPTVRNQHLEQSNPFGVVLAQVQFWSTSQEFESSFDVIQRSPIIAQQTIAAPCDRKTTARSGSLLRLVPLPGCGSASLGGTLLGFLGLLGLAGCVALVDGGVPHVLEVTLGGGWVLLHR